MEEGDTGNTKKLNNIKKNGPIRRDRSKYTKNLIGKRPDERTPPHCRIKNISRVDPSYANPVHLRDEQGRVEACIFESIGYVKRSTQQTKRAIKKAKKNPAHLEKTENRFETQERHLDGVEIKIPTWLILLEKTRHADEVANSYALSRLPPMNLNNMPALFQSSGTN
jgi:hypothetical protein